MVIYFSYLLLLFSLSEHRSPKSVGRLPRNFAWSEVAVVWIHRDFPWTLTLTSEKLTVGFGTATDAEHLWQISWKSDFCTFREVITSVMNELTNERTNEQTNTPEHNISRRSWLETYKAQIPLCRLSRDVRDKPMTFPSARIPLRRLPRNFPVGVMRLPRKGKFRGSRRNGIWAKGDVTGLSRISRGRHGKVGIVEFGLKLLTVWYAETMNTNPLYSMYL